MSDVHAHVQQMAKMLKNLDRHLNKAIEHAKHKSFDPAVLLQARLAPDMLPLLNQIQIACDGCKNLVARAAGQEPPKHPDDEQTLDELRARIQTTRDYLASFGPSDFEGWESRVVPLFFMPGKGMLAPDFLRQFALPNTYFHFVTAYAILRHNGVPLGKPDYIGGLTLRDL